MFAVRPHVELPPVLGQARAAARAAGLAYAGSVPPCSHVSQAMARDEANAERP